MLGIYGFLRHVPVALDLDQCLPDCFCELLFKWVLGWSGEMLCKFSDAGVSHRRESCRFDPVFPRRSHDPADLRLPKSITGLDVSLTQARSKALHRLHGFC